MGFPFIWLNALMEMWIFVHVYSWGLTHFTINVKPISVVLYVNFEHYWWFSIVFPFHSLFIFLFMGVRKYGIFIISTWEHFQGWWWRIACLGTGLLSWVLGSIRPGLANHRQGRRRAGDIRKTKKYFPFFACGMIVRNVVVVCILKAMEQQLSTGTV